MRSHSPRGTRAPGRGVDTGQLSEIAIAFGRVPVGLSGFGGRYRGLVAVKQSCVLEKKNSPRSPSWCCSESHACACSSVMPLRPTTKEAMNGSRAVPKVSASSSHVANGCAAIRTSSKPAARNRLPRVRGSDGWLRCSSHASSTRDVSTGSECAARRLPSRCPTRRCVRPVEARDASRPMPRSGQGRTRGPARTARRQSWHRRQATTPPLQDEARRSRARRNGGRRARASLSWGRPRSPLRPDPPPPPARHSRSRGRSQHREHVRRQRRRARRARSVADAARHRSGTAPRSSPQPPR